MTQFKGLSFGDYETVASVIERTDLDGLVDIKNLIETREAVIAAEKNLFSRQQNFYELRRCNEWSGAGLRCELDRWHDGDHAYV